VQVVGQRYYGRGDYSDSHGYYRYSGGRRVYVECHSRRYTPGRDDCGKYRSSSSSSSYRTNSYDDGYYSDSGRSGSYTMQGYEPRGGSSYGSGNNYDNDYNKIYNR
jgi:hypothetical protein